jgi:SAM-dependent methyltransferase
MEKVDHWQSLWGQTYAEKPTEGDPTLVLAGWNSSYTGKPIRPEEMKDWVERTVERILALSPRRVVELGCGMGLLLFRIAPRVDAYWGVDFSAEALAHVGEHAARLGLANVELLQQGADDFTRLRQADPPFDTLVINSVLQYFPDMDYLLRVLENAQEILVPGGRIFLGDIRSLPLLPAFHASVQMLQAEGTTPVAELRERVEKLTSEERELALAPSFFAELADLRRRFPRITRVELQLKRGRYRNELTRFRYDAVLWLDGSGAVPEPGSWLGWREEGLTLPDLKRRLIQEQPAILGVRGIPNARILPETRAVELIQAGASEAGPLHTVDDLLAAMRGVRGGIEPEDLWGLSKTLPYEIEVGWAEDNPDGSFQAVFRRRG